MEQGKQEWEASLRELRQLTGSDFAALALIEHPQYQFRWHMASGNRNERYKRILLPAGKGIEGKVVRNLRTFTIDCFTPKQGDDPRDYVILLAEGLKSIGCAPVVHENSCLGVLLVGRRQVKPFDEAEVDDLNGAALQYAELLKERMETTG